MPTLVSTSLALSLAFSPWSADAPVVAGPTLHLAAPDAEGDKSWDDVAAEDAEVPPPTPTEDDETLAPAPASTPAPVPTKANANAKPEYRKGTGLIVAASITGGIGWALGLTRMAFVQQCVDAAKSADSIDTGASAGSKCLLRAGAGNLGLGILQYGFNIATWGLAPAAGAVRGRWDGVDRAWSAKARRKAGVFIGVGAGVLALGVIGRITAAVLVGRPFRHLDPTNFDADAFSRDYRLRLFGVQLSSAAIAAGAGLLAFGVAHGKAYDAQSKFLKQVRVAPAFNLDPRSGSSYAGVALSGRF
ncbi:MAG: hypothetical protein IPH07_17465 [Deltaproteobacteria bacterium]|nr:hypothetical protein [Deltaproteobacteria bacterium]MBK8239559.1 hypothetical protein [Deltaproteobacteria bacterium]MBK8719357.1 hypothetical protein [Deltaproteobacteria bacterium]MBP7290073.1 hypothetical protein [Nannocystaceae bacterium]